MASKTISVTEDVYERLVRVKRDNESFSQFFTRLLDQQRENLKRMFGAWDLSPEEREEIWGDIGTRPGRSWSRTTGDPE